MADEVDRTLWCGNLGEDVTEELLYELFVQAGPLESVNIAKDKEGRRRAFAFIRFKHVESVPYTIQLMNGIQMFGRNLRLQVRPGSIHEEAKKGSSQRREPQMNQNDQRDQRHNGGRHRDERGHNHSGNNQTSPRVDYGRDKHQPHGHIGNSPSQMGNELHRSNTWPRFENGQELNNEPNRDGGHRRQNSREHFMEFGKTDNFVMKHQPMSQAEEDERRFRLQQAQMAQLQAASRMQQNYQYNNQNRGQWQQSFRGQRW